MRGDAFTVLSFKATNSLLKNLSYSPSIISFTWGSSCIKQSSTTTTCFSLGRDLGVGLFTTCWETGNQTCTKSTNHIITEKLYEPCLIDGALKIYKATIPPVVQSTTTCLSSAQFPGQPGSCSLLEPVKWVSRWSPMIEGSKKSWPSG